MRDGFVYYRSLADAMANLPAESYKSVMTAICGYALDDITPVGLDPLCQAIFTLIKPQIDANNRRYANGQKGGRPKKETEPNQTETKPKPNQNQTITKPKPNVTEAKPKEKEKDKDKEKEINKEKEMDPALRDAVKDYEAYRRRIKAPLTDRALDLALAKLEQLAPGDTPTKVAIINQSIMNGWKGLFAIKDDKRPANAGIQRGTDYDALIRRMR